MGAQQSQTGREERPDSDMADVPIQFSRDVMNQLADAAAAPGPSFRRQSTLDERIQERIFAEVARLRGEEELVKEQIERALEKENLDREAAHFEKAAGEGEGEGEEGTPLNSVVLLGDLEEVRQKVDKFHAKESAVGQHASEAAQEAFTCYKNNPSRPLDCYVKVRAFQQVVGDMEREYLSLLQ